MSFWSELKRRNVYKAGAAYLVGAWLVAQVIDIVLPTFDAPQWVGRTVIVLLLIGFPVVLAVAWAFELTEHGIKRTSDVPPEKSITRITGQKLTYVVIGLMAVAITFLVVDGYLVEGGISAGNSAAAAADPAANAPTARNAPAPLAAREVLDKSVAVLPFDSLSPEQDDQFFAAGIHEEVLNRLGRLGNVSVISRTSVMRYADTDLTIPEIANELRVKTVMEGSVRYAGARVRVTANLIDAATDESLWTEVYERDFADIFAIQADIAMSIANALEAEFTPAEQESIERLPTKSLEAYQLYLSALAAQRANQNGAALRLFDNAIVLDPEFYEAWLGKAQQLGIMIAFAGGEFDEIKDRMVDAAMRAIRLDPADPRGYTALGMALGQQGKWLRAEEEYRRALALGMKPDAMGQYFLLQLAVGNFAGARDSIEGLLRVDPLNQGPSGFLLAAYERLGDTAARRAHFERGEQVFGSWWGETIEMVLRLGDRDVDFLRTMDASNPFVAEGQRNLDTPQVFLERARAAFAAHEIRTPAAHFLTANFAAYFGDPQLAFDLMSATIRDQLEVTVWYLWLPLYDDVRKQPGFKPLIRELGLPEYWRTHGWPEFCRPLGADDFECT